MEKVYKVITNIVRLIIFIVLLLQIWQGNFKYVGILTLTFALTFYDIVLEKLFHFVLRPSLKVSIILFILGAQVMGTVLDWYGKFSWWDTMLHTISGVIFMYVGMTLVEEISQRNNFETNPIITILFGFCFALAVGVFWELLEFCVDRFLGGNMQRTAGETGQNAIMDTMIDLLSALIGAGVTTILEIRKKDERK